MKRIKILGVLLLLLPIIVNTSCRKKYGPGIYINHPEWLTHEDEDETENENDSNDEAQFNQQ